MTSRQAALDELRDQVAASGLIDRGSTVVVMTSGGADSACAAAALTSLLGPEAVHALHVNYGLREGARAAEAACRELCAALRLDLHIERPDPAALRGENLQAAARELRYAAAERLRARTGADLIVTGHTLTDLAETVVYRLATSPGSRSLLGLPAARGRIVRPLLDLPRRRSRALAAAARLPFADDETNDDVGFARNRVRARVLPELHELSAAAERNIARTRAELEGERRLLDQVVLEVLEASGAGAGAVAIRAEAIAGYQPALRRLALRALAERAAGRSVPLGDRRAEQIMRLAARPEGGAVDLGGGLAAVCESGEVRFRAATVEAAPEPVSMRLPGSITVGGWEIRAEIHPAPFQPAGPGLATLDARRVGRRIEIRTWREGDRIRPLGMTGTKTLGDLFTDRGVPRTLRRVLPVVVADDRIAWVPGVAVSEDFRIGARTEEVAVLSVRAPEEGAR